jgi:hypothetical protein
VVLIKAVWPFQTHKAEAGVFQSLFRQGPTGAKFTLAGAHLVSVDISSSPLSRPDKHG